MHTQKPMLPKDPLAPLAKALHIQEHLHTFSSCRNNFNSWMLGSKELQHIQSPHWTQCAPPLLCTCGQFPSQIALCRTGQWAQWLLLFIHSIGGYFKIVHLNKTSSFNPVCMIKSYPVHTMQGRFLSFQSPNLMSETEEMCYFGCK